MLLAGVLEYVLASGRLEEVTLRESTKGYLAQVVTLEARLAATVGTDGRQVAMQDELDHIKATYGVEYAALFDAGGGLVAAAAAGRKTEDRVDAQGLSDVLSSQRPLVRVEADQGEVGEAGRYEFLLPVRSPEG
ncbi:MAG: hypothetical protein M3537_05040, partial [Chloroflexota bacterium]|nr:hypothetical protein [Chloroflexota bacterium]